MATPGSVNGCQIETWDAAFHEPGFETFPYFKWDGPTTRTGGIDFNNDAISSWKMHSEAGEMCAFYLFAVDKNYGDYPTVYYSVRDNASITEADAKNVGLNGDISSIIIREEKPDCTVQLFAEDNYTGASAEFGIGEYYIAMFIAHGISGDALSSLQVTAYPNIDCEVTLFADNLGGTNTIIRIPRSTSVATHSFTLSSGAYSFMNNAVSSMIVGVKETITTVEWSLDSYTVLSTASTVMGSVTYSNNATNSVISLQKTWTKDATINWEVSYEQSVPESVSWEIEFGNPSFNTSHPLSISLSYNFSITKSNGGSSVESYSESINKTIVPGDYGACYWTITQYIIDIPFTAKIATIDAYGQYIEQSVDGIWSSNGTAFYGNSSVTCVSSTDTPTLNPSSDPSAAPSTIPTLAPSLTPTNAPSTAPSNDPSNAPSVAPTVPPTTVPSNNPTSAPSVAPTNAPTACIDYYDYKSLDGVDVTYEIETPDVTYEMESVQQYTTSITPEYINFFNEELVCNNSNVDLCLILCAIESSCIQTVVRVVVEELDEVTIVCKERTSCHGVELIVNNTVNTVSVICTAKLSCENANVLIAVNTDINIYCDAAFSCKNMLIELYEYEINAVIYCYVAYACDGLLIETKHSNNIFIQLIAYRYSKDIVINHYNWTNVQVECGVDRDHRYIRYDTHELLDPTEVLQSARNEYKESHRLPCEDISILCAVDAQCVFEYELYNFSLSDLVQMSDKDKPDCYWLDSVQMFKAECSGTCGDTIHYYVHNKILRLRIVLDSTEFDAANASTMNRTKSYRVCDEYFGIMNDTETTLSSIDAIFDAVLSIIHRFDVQMLHNVLIPPETQLIMNATFIECINEERNTIDIETNVTFESIASNKRQIDQLFQNELIPLFEHLLSEFFDLPITFEMFDTLTNITFDGIKVWVVILIVLSALFIIALIIIIFVRKRKQQRDKIEALTTYIRNPMIVSVGIAFYDQEPEAPGVDGIFRNLNGIKQDTKQVMDLFGAKLNYTVYPKANKHRWTSVEVVQFLEERASDLEANIDCYDGLVVILSCHGIKDNIVSSDYKAIEKTVIHRIFSMKRPSLRKMPRIFIYDCCDGDDDRDKGFRCDTIYQTQETQKGEMDAVDTKGVDWLDEMEQKAEGTDVNKAKVEMAPRSVADLGKNKNIDLSAVQPDVPMWLLQEDNPDFKLVTVHASNTGFQSKMDLYKGSYLITNFIEKLNENIFEGNNKRFLYEIFDEIQQDLHSEGKQQLVSTYYNYMRYIKFLKNGNDVLRGSNADTLNEILDDNHNIDANDDDVNIVCVQEEDGN